MHAALPLCEWRTPPGRTALRDELRRCEAALRAVNGGHSYLRTAACAWHDASPAAGSAGSAGAHALHTPRHLHSSTAAHHPAAALAALTLRVPGLEHLADAAAAEAAAPLAHGGGQSSALAEEGSEGPSPRASALSGSRHWRAGAMARHRASHDGDDAHSVRSDAEEPSADEAAAAAAVAALRDPAAGLAAAVAAFAAARAAADDALAAAVAARRGAAGSAAHARAFAALGRALRPLPGRAAPPAALDRRRAAAEAEAARLRGELADVARAAWFTRTLHHAADGGRGGISRGEAAVLERVKRTIEAGVDFGAEQLFDLVLALRRDELEAADVQRLLLLLREEVGVPPAALRAFMREHGLPLPLALQIGGAAALGRAAAASSLLGGPRGTAGPAARASQLFTPRTSQAVRFA